jgi:hypothetical protein
MPTLNITPRLTAALRAREQIDYKVPSWILADALEAALAEGLQALAAAYGRQFALLKLDKHGEFTLYPIDGEGVGHELAAWLNIVPVRLIGHVGQEQVRSETRQVYIHRLSAEQLLDRLLAAVDIADTPPFSTTPQ